MASSFPMQPLEFQDFSGGITENILQGNTSRYAVADNWLITVDKKLTVRPGFLPYDLTNYTLPSGDQRVNGLFSFQNETLLMAQSGRKIFYVNKYTNLWTEILGPTGNQAMSNGDEYSQTSYGEFQKQIYMASDDLTQPVKIYKNEESLWIAKTAGLPRAFTTGNYNDSTLLGSCINLANHIRGKMIQHLKDAVNGDTFLYQTLPTYQFSNLHSNIDKQALCYLEAVTFPINFPATKKPDPIPTPVLSASSKETLFDLVFALNTAYELHMGDSYGWSMSQGVGDAPYFHQMFQVLPRPDLGYPLPPSGPHARLNNVARPKTLDEAAAQLDDIHQKFGWHQRGVLIHSPNNEPTQFDRYRIELPKIGKIQRGSAIPTITPDFTDSFNFANNIKFLYNGHVTNNISTNGWGGSHSQPSMFVAPYSTDFKCKLPDVTDDDSFCLMTYWLRALYFMHSTDATAPTHINCTYTATAGSKTISAVVGPGGLSMILMPGAILFSTNGFGPVVQDMGNIFAATRIAIVKQFLGGGQYLLDRPSLVTGTLLAGQMQGSMNGVNSFYHVYRTNPGPSDPTLPTYVTYSGENQSQPADVLTTQPFALGTDAKNWLELLSEMFRAYASHQAYMPVHQIDADPREMFNNSAYLPNQLFIPEIESVVYAFIFTDRYVVDRNGVEYLVRSNPVYSEVTYIPVSYPINTVIKSENTDWYPNFTVKNQRGTTISNLPKIVNTDETNYDVNNIKLEIYRTTNGGTIYYKLDELDNGTTSYLDLVNDSIANPGDKPLDTRETLYTTGGVVGWDQPPKAKFIHTLNGTTFYGGIEDAGQFFPNRIRQSVQYAPDAAPATFYDDLDDEITGISSTRSNLIAFCKDSIYRMSQGFNQLGQGALLHERIADTLGALNQKSIVRTEIGIFFAGNDGFYYTDGYQIIKISLELDKTYAAMTRGDSQKRRIYGAYDKQTRRVWWSMQRNPSDTNNDVFYVFYLNYGVKPSGTFTTSSSDDFMRASSVVFQNGKMFFGHERGLIFKSDTHTKTDPIIDMTKPAAEWQKKHIPYDWISCAVDGGTAFKRKWITKMHLIGDNTGNMSIQPMAIRDMNYDYKGIKPLAPINYTDNVTWGNPTCVWGDPTAVWNNKGKLDLWRRFPQTTLRSDFIQFQIKPADEVVYSSSVNYPFGANAIVNAAADTVTIITPTEFTDIVWPKDVVDMFISFAWDEYQTRFKILSRVSKNVLSVDDPDGLLIDVPGGIEWQISGIKKEQRPTITSLILHYSLLGDKTQKYPGAHSNDGPGNGGANP